MKSMEVKSSMYVWYVYYVMFVCMHIYTGKAEHGSTQF